MASIETRPRSNGTVGYRVVWRDPDSPRAKDSLTFDDLKEAERLVKFLDANDQRLKKATEVMAAIKQHIPTVAEVVEHHIAHLTNVEDRTRRDYRGMLKHHIAPHIGGIPATLLDEDRAREWVIDVYAGKGTDWDGLPVAAVMAELETAAPKTVAARRGISIRTVRRLQAGHTKAMSSKTLHNVHALLSAAMNTGTRMKLPDGSKLLTENPCAGIPLPPLYRTEMVFLTPGEYSLIRAHIRAHYRPLVDFLAGSGARWGEAIALNVEDVDLTVTPATVRISKAVKRAENGTYVGAPKTLMSVRTVSLPASVANVLLPLTIDRDPDAPLFTGPRGGVVHYGKFRSEVWVPAVQAAQAAHDDDWVPVPRAMRLLKNPGIHSLRHSHVSWLIASRKVDLTIVQRRVGHESYKTTVDKYGHLMPDALEIAANAADSVMAPVLELVPASLAGDHLELAG